MSFEKYYPDIIRSISDLIRMPTVYDAATVTRRMPYGKGVYSGYERLRNKALTDGFEVLEFDGHALAIRIPGIFPGKGSMSYHTWTWCLPATGGMGTLQRGSA